MLSASPVFVNDNWQLTTDSGSAGVSSGDIVTATNETLGAPPQVATYGTNGFGSVLQASQNFNNGSDAGWTRYSPLSPLGAGATYSFPASSAGGLGYRIQNPASPSPGTAGPARAGSVLASNFNDFRISVDLVGWNDVLDQAFGLLGRVSNVGLGGTNGYTLSYNNLDHVIELNRITGEAPTPLGQASVTLNPANDYTLTLTGIGSSLTSQIFAIGSTTPLASFTVNDAMYASGQVGVFNFDASDLLNGTTDSTFDNFTAYGGASTINTALAGTTAGGITNILDGQYSENVLVNTDVRLAGSGTITGTLITAGGGAIITPGIGTGAGQFHTGAVTLSSNSSLQIGLIAPVVIDNFNAVRAWPIGFTTEYGTSDSFNNSVTQDGGGTLVIAGTANEQGGLYRERNGETLYNLTGRTQIEAIAKLGAGNAADAFVVSLMDSDGTEYLYSFATSGLNASTFTILTHDLSKPDVISGVGDAGLDLANITSFQIRGDYSSPNALRLVFDNLQVGGQDQLDVTGAVNLTGATLSGTLVGFTPTAGQQFTIIQNDGIDLVSGTFASLAQGATVTLSGNAFTISYVGGTGNDVVLTSAAAAIATVAGRRLFYNNSKFDGNLATADAADDSAIASDKAALLPGQTAAFGNVSSYSRGINGVMLDIQGLSASPTASDFIFRTGNDNTPAGWATAANPTVTVRAGAGTGGSSRVTLTWPDGTLKNTWLQVTAKTSLGLAAADVFYFGNAVGESGNPVVANFLVNSTDEIGARNNPKTFLSPAIVTDAYDFNRDGYVNATDQILTRSNSTTTANDLNVITVPASLVAESQSIVATGVNVAQTQVAVAPSAQPTTRSAAAPSLLKSQVVDQICEARVTSISEQRASFRRAAHAAALQFEHRLEHLEADLVALLARGR